MRLVIIESPYNGPTQSIIDEHIAYARRAIRDSMSHNEAPIASHLLYTQSGILRDEIPEEREMGIRIGHAWHQAKVVTVVYIDYGFSNGMREGIKAAEAHKTPIVFRSIGRNPS